MAGNCNQIFIDVNPLSRGRTIVRNDLHAGDVPLQNSQYTMWEGVSSVIDINQSFSASAERVSGTILNNQRNRFDGTIRGMLVCLDSTNRWVRANATSQTSSARLLGIALNDAGGGQLLDVLIEGVITLGDYHTDLGSITPGVPLYAWTTGGFVSETPPSSTGDVVRIIGHNIDGDVVGRTSWVTIRFKPDNTWIEL
jgi:hypothetical protein